jgi:hypothetical protein
MLPTSGAVSRSPRILKLTIPARRLVSVSLLNKNPKLIYAVHTVFKFQVPSGGSGLVDRATGGVFGFRSRNLRDCDDHKVNPKTFDHRFDTAK